MKTYELSEIKMVSLKDWPSYFLVHEEGCVFEVRKNEIGIFSSMIDGEANPGYRYGWSEGVILNLPHIKTDMLMQILAAFRDIYTRCGPYEAVAHIYWSSVCGYYVQFPRQVVSGAGIDLEWDNERCQKDLLVLEIHSHHEMNAFFSSIDNEYEKATRFYAVVGKINRFFPDIRLRFANGAHYHYVGLDVLFHAGYPVQWMENIKLRRCME